MNLDTYYAKLIQALISKHTKPITKGKYKGHGTTDTVAWMEDLHHIVTSNIKKRNRGRGAYDENMAISREMGRALVVWYCAVHRAKSYDPNRPLARKRANASVTRFRGELMAAISSDEIMGAVFGNQYWNFPYGKGAFGGDFI